MDQHRFEALIRAWRGVPSRRHLLRGLAGAGFGLGVARLPAGGEAKRRNTIKSKNTGQGKGKPRLSARKGQSLCKRNGAKCTTSGKNCKKRFCLNAPFTIEANWTKTADHDTYLFVPAENETTGPSPFIHHACTPDTSKCEEEYPFACVNKDEQQSGSEITTIHQLLPGTYEYWVELATTTPAGELTIVLKDNDGRVVRQWTNPANDSATIDVGWHVFDVNGNNGRVTSIDELNEPGYLPDAAHDPNTNVCPQ